MQYIEFIFKIYVRNVSKINIFFSNFYPLTKSYFFCRCPNFGSKCDCDSCNQTSDTKVLETQNGSDATSKLAETFPSILTAEGKKSPPIEEPAKPLTVTEDDGDVTEDDENEKDDEEDDDDDEKDLIEDLTKTLEESNLDPDSNKSKITAKDQSKQPCKADQQALPPKKATTAKELRDLMYQHYCVGKGMFRIDGSKFS